MQAPNAEMKPLCRHIDTTAHSVLFLTDLLVLKKTSLLQDVICEIQQHLKNGIYIAI